MQVKFVTKLIYMLTNVDQTLLVIIYLKYFSVESSRKTNLQSKQLIKGTDTAKKYSVCNLQKTLEILGN